MDIPVRRRRRKKNNTKLYLLIAGCSVVLIALIIVACCLGGKDDSSNDGNVPGGDGPLPALTIDQIEEQGETVKIDTSYMDMKYPFAFSDLIHVRANDGEAIKKLEFFTVLEGNEYRLFDIILGGSEGIRLGDVKVPDRSATVPVFAKLYTEGEDLADELKRSYAAAQECFNDVAQSLHENEGYSPMR